MFKWGEFGDTSDVFDGHPNSVDTLLKIDENTLITGSSDGLIRVINITPHRLVGILGEHDEDMPIERMSLSYDNNWIASCSHDETVRFWYATDFFEVGDDGQPLQTEIKEIEMADEIMEENDMEDIEIKQKIESESEDDQPVAKKKKAKQNRKYSKKKEFFSGL